MLCLSYGFNKTLLDYLLHDILKIKHNIDIPTDCVLRSKLWSILINKQVNKPYNIMDLQFAVFIIVINRKIIEEKVNAH